MGDKVNRLPVPEELDDVDLLIDISGFVHTDESGLSVCDLESSGVSAIHLR
jgi:hypothetical protein